MPNMDKTGPQGKGPQTGRGLGNCNNTSTEALRPCGRPCGRVRGGGMGRGTGAVAGVGRGMSRGMGRGFNQNVKTD
jgi:hypothetical protein